MNYYLDLTEAEPRFLVFLQEYNDSWLFMTTDSTVFSIQFETLRKMFKKKHLIPIPIDPLEAAFKSFQKNKDISRWC